MFLKDSSQGSLKDLGVPSHRRKLVFQIAQDPPIVALQMSPTYC